MKRAGLGLLMIVAALPSFAALKQGDTAPQFKTRASLAGKEFTFSLADALKKGPVVVYFYPSAYTGGCNVQAHEFAVNYDKFAAAGASVVGVSLDNITRLNEFSADPEYCAGKLPVASDEKGEIAKSYDLKITTEYNGKSFLTMKDSRGSRDRSCRRGAHDIHRDTRRQDRRDDRWRCAEGKCHEGIGSRSAVVSAEGLSIRLPSRGQPEAHQATR